MPRDLSAVWAWMDQWERKMSRLFSGAFLENSSVTNGRLRFIGGLLKLDSGATLDGDGTFRWKGEGSIEGDFEVLGDGRFRVGGVLISPLGGGRIEIGGPGGIILDGATGKLTAGGMTIDPTDDGGSVIFGGGRRIHAGSGFLGLYDGERFVVFNSSGVAISGGGAVTMVVMPSGVQLTGLPTRTRANSNNAVVGTLWTDGSALYRVV